jgi:crotonobetainyl-CoA:carnitine CoA-transferase CaiB-like acyl-CoA transferase
VVELAGSAAGGYAGRLFAGWGAMVTLVGERSDTDPYVAAFLDAAKRRAGADDPTLDELVAEADVVVESAAPDPLRAVTTDRRRLVRVEISPFGSNGPYAEWRSTDLTDQAIAGHLFLNGDPEREPVAGPALQAAYAAGLHGFIGAVAALRAGLDGTIEVAHHEVMTSRTMCAPGSPPSVPTTRSPSCRRCGWRRGPPDH